MYLNYRGRRYHILMYSDKDRMVYFLAFLGCFMIASFITSKGLFWLPPNIILTGRQSEVSPAFEDDTSHTGEYKVPNIVHFIWFWKDKTLGFINYLSILSAHKIQKPDVIMLHCNDLPVGEWWEKLWKEVPLTIMYRQPPSKIHGQTLLHMYHKGDVAKMEILMKYGGIYLDYDVILITSFDPLRKYPMTFGRELLTPRLNAGIIVAYNNSVFLHLMYESYRNNYRPLDWDYNCQRVTYDMYRQRPDLVHIEPRRLTSPDNRQRHLLYKEIINWRDLYCIHLIMHLDWTVYNPDKIKKENNTFGEITRNIYYGSPEIR